MTERSSRRSVLMGAAALGVSGLGVLGLAACGRGQDKTAPAEPEAPKGPPEGSLEWAVAGSWRTAEDKARDVWRHPVETLRFFGLQPKMTVVDFWPGS